MRRLTSLPGPNCREFPKLFLNNTSMFRVYFPGKVFQTVRTSFVSMFRRQPPSPRDEPRQKEARAPPSLPQPRCGDGPCPPSRPMRRMLSATDRDKPSRFFWVPPGSCQGVLSDRSCHPRSYQGSVSHQSCQAKSSRGRQASMLYVAR